MAIAFKGTVVYDDLNPQDPESPLDFKNLPGLLNSCQKKFEFEISDPKGNEGPELRITRTKEVNIDGETM